MPRGRAKPFGPAAYLDPAGGSTGPGVRRGRGVPVAGEALGGVHQPTLPVTAST